MPRLHQYLMSQHEAIVQRWIARIQSTLVSPALPNAELRDHVPYFLEEIVHALRDADDEADADAEAAPQTSPSAAEHGGQRLRMGFDLGAVVREYGVLQECILTSASEAGIALDPREHQVLSACTITGIAEAVTEYSRQRDAELQRQATEHLAFIAHELRNPLFSSMLSLGSLRRRGRLPDERATRSLEGGLLQMQELIDRTLKEARIGSGIDLRLERIDLRAILEDARQQALSAAEDAEIAIRIEVEGDPELLADRRLFRSAVGNLVNNAVKFTHPKSTVVLRGKLSGSRVVIEVEDGCGGLAADFADKAFSPFVRLSSEQPGFGLGLAIVKQAAEAHGGSTRVQNLPGKGCIFLLELPTQAANATPAGPGATGDAS